MKGVGKSGRIRLSGLPMKWVLVTVSLVELAMIGGLVIVLSQANSIINRRIPQIHALHEIRVALTEAHLWLEESVSSPNPEVHRVKYRESFIAAEDLLDGVISGGVTEDGFRLPSEGLEEIDTLLAIRKEIEWLSTNADERSASPGLFGVDSEMDEVFDERFAKTLERLRENEARTFHTLTRRNHQFLILMVVLIMSLVALGLGTLAMVRNALVTRQRALESVNKAKLNLEEEVKRRTEQLISANRELESFSYSVSHDLRSPLRSIDGFSQALLEDYSGKLDATAQDYLARIINSAQRMGKLIDDLLKLSRLNRDEMVWQRVDLTSMIQELVEDLKLDEPTRSVEVKIEPEMYVTGDKNLVRVCMQNLIGNAWKFTRGRMNVLIEVGKLEEDEVTSFYVRDNGTGFDMKYANKLFGAFQRLHSTSEFEGTGIGLATVQRVVVRHGGTVSAEGKPGEGATFTVNFGKHVSEHQSVSNGEAS